MPGQYEPITVSPRISARRVRSSGFWRTRASTSISMAAGYRGVASGTTIRSIGDVFVMNMYVAEVGVCPGD